jgi:hypothetical protein
MTGSFHAAFLLLMRRPDLPAHSRAGKLHRGQDRVVDGDTSQLCQFLSRPISPYGLCRATSRAFLILRIKHNDVESQQRHKECDSVQLCATITSPFSGPCAGYLSDLPVNLPIKQFLIAAHAIIHDADDELAQTQILVRMPFFEQMGLFLTGADCSN